MKIRIENKRQSMEYIQNLHLNILPEQYFEQFKEDEIIRFLKNYPADYYAVRIKDKAMSSKHKLAVPYDEVLIYCKDLVHFTLNVSSYCYRNNQVLVGEIKILDNMEIEYILSNNPSYSVRNCYENPDYAGKSDIYDKKLLKIKGINEIIDYILKNDLTNIIVEFTVFDCKIGRNNENVVIWELRTDY